MPNRAPLRPWLLLSLALAAGASSACGGSGGGSKAPVISSFAALPSTISAGNATLLAWGVSGATSLSIDQGVGAVTGTSTLVSPASTTTYTLTATSSGGSATARATVTVNQVAPVIVAFTASPVAIAAGGSSTLAWTVNGATSLSIDQGIGTVTGSSTPVSPASTRTYTLTASNPNGSATASATVVVGAIPLQVACSGASCGALDGTRYSGTGIGMWRYQNSTAAAVTISLGIGGVHGGQSALLLFSNGQNAATALPSAGALASPVLDLAWLGADLPPEPDPAEAAQDQAHQGLLERNRALAVAARGPASSPSPSPSLAPPAPLATPAVGASRTWYDNYDSANPVTYTAVAKVVCALPSGRNAVFWVDPAVTTAGGVTDADLAYFQTTFCGAGGGYGSVTGLRGDVWGSYASTMPTAVIQDAAGALQDVHIVFLNVPSTTGWAGYFYGYNNFLRARSGYANSNEALAFFINGPGVKVSRGAYASTLLHELTHMVNFYQRYLVRNGSNDTWLEEMLAMMTEDIVTPAATPDHFAKIPDGRIKPYVQKGGAVSLVDWVTLSSGSYAIGGTFGAFLNRRYGLAVYTGTNGCATGITSYACVDGLIRVGGGAGLADEFDRLGASVYGLLPVGGTPAGYGFPQATAGAFTLGAVDLAGYASARPATAAPLGTGFSATTHTYQLDTIATGASSYARWGVSVPAGATMLLVIQ